METLEENMSNIDMQVAEDLRRVERWWNQNAPDAPRRFFPPATAKELDDAEEAIGVKLLSEVRSLYQVHNGADQPIFPNAYDFLTLEKVVRVTEMWDELLEDPEFSNIGTPEGPIRPVWWNSKWMPIAGNDADYVCIDHDPVLQGIVGQVVQFDHEFGPRRVVADSFGAWLHEFADDLEGGVYGYERYDLVRVVPEE